MVGLVVLLDRIGGTDRAVSLISDWWPIAIIGVGLGSLVGLIKQPWALLGPLIVVAIGAVLLLITTDVVKLQVLGDVVGTYLVPVLLIGLGAVVALSGPITLDPEGQRVRRSAVLFPKRADDVRALQRGTATAVLARLEFDLTKVELDREQPPAELDITAFFGRVEVVVPTSWRVELHRPVGVGVRQIKALSAQQLSPDEVAGRLQIHVLAFFGGAALRQT
jgi:hypothetical protein